MQSFYREIQNLVQIYWSLLSYAVSYWGRAPLQPCRSSCSVINTCIRCLLTRDMECNATEECDRIIFVNSTSMVPGLESTRMCDNPREWCFCIDSNPNWFSAKWYFWPILKRKRWYNSRIWKHLNKFCSTYANKGVLYTHFKLYEVWFLVSRIRNLLGRLIGGVLNCTNYPTNKFSVLKLVITSVNFNPQ